MKKKQKPYAELVSQAEEATSAVKDPELRRVAFERVLDDLLSGSGIATQSNERSAKRAGRSTDKPSKSRKPRGPKDHIRKLIEDRFFEKPKTIAEVKAELANRGYHIPVTSLSGPLQSLCRERVLRRNKAKSGEKGKKPVYKYSIW